VKGLLQVVGQDAKLTVGHLVVAQGMVSYPSLAGKAVEVIARTNVEVHVLGPDAPNSGSVSYL
jgi:hypothetical protein